MKTKTKVTLVILPMLIMGIISINIAFGLFFQKFIQESEKDKIQVSDKFISTYINEKNMYYQGTVNDWAHWDDTYYFLENSNKEYVDLNMTDSAMRGIDISFAVFLNTEDIIKYQKFYDYDEEISTQMAPELLENSVDLIKFSKIDGDTSGMINIGDNYYFVASSLITDSLEEENSNGTLIIGRKIDSDIISRIEKSSGISVSDITVVDDISRLNEQDTSNVLGVEYDGIDNNAINVEVAIPNIYDRNSSIVISIVIPRDLYLRGMKDALEFAYFNTIGSLVVGLIIFLLLGKLITKPFVSLMDDVKSIDLTNSEMKLIPENGTEEFVFLRRSINNLMNRTFSTREELIKSREELHATLLSIGEGIIAIDKNSEIKFMNTVAQKMTGWKLQESINRQLKTVLVVIDEALEAPLGNSVEEVFKNKGIIKMSQSTSLIAKEGNRLDVNITVSPIKDINGAVTGCVLAINDITENKKRQRHIEYLSYRDILTGVYNRSFYEEKIKEFEGKDNFDLSIIMIDVNGLKLTNDAFGHGTGDRLLVKVAECIERSIRTEDILCRLGGDEFVILLPNTDSKELKSIVTRINLAISKEKIENIPISVSIGWATKQKNSETMEFIFKNAEDMMYNNKSAENKSQRHQTIQVIMKTLFEKNPREEAHSKRVSEICLKIGEYMELDLSKTKNLQTAGLLHDIGKIGVSNNCLDKTAPLNEEEWLEIKKHPQISHSILSSVNEYGPLANIVLSHHERWDGKGYPNGLIGEKIPLESRVIALADAFDAMVSDRPYRKGMKEKEALEIIEREAGKQFDPKLAKLFIENADVISPVVKLKK